MTGDHATHAGLLTVVSGPSGVGKSCIVRSVRERLNADLSISATTRPKTAQESDGEDYYFLSEAEFAGMVERGEFLEYARVFGKDSYGTPRLPVESALADGKLIILEIDVQGGLQVRRAMPDALLIFIKPPAIETLLERLRGRGRDNEAAIQRRYAEARSEIAKAESSGVYDEFVINDDLDTAIDATCAIIERRRLATRP